MSSSLLSLSSSGSWSSAPSRAGLTSSIVLLIMLLSIPFTIIILLIGHGRILDPVGHNPGIQMFHLYRQNNKQQIAIRTNVPSTRQQKQQEPFHTSPMNQNNFGRADHNTPLEPPSELSSILPYGFQSILERAKQYRQHCNEINLDLSVAVNSSSSHHKKGPRLNETINANLPPFGIIDALQSWEKGKKISSSTGQIENDWPMCELPPETECQETKFTVVFMAHNPDRLHLLMINLKFFLIQEAWIRLVKEVVLVWNGSRSLHESDDGRKILDLVSMGNRDPKKPNVRIFYPLNEGFQNDLMNRYHPRFNITTKAILYYDDDGPFRVQDVTIAAFELWKRNANVQVGPLGRQYFLSPRQELEKENRKQHSDLDDDSKFSSPSPFVSMCSAKGDQLDYNFHTNPDFGSNMVLPSGTFLHVNYLCFIWHPALEGIRSFVRSHPVFPDDHAVSMIVSQLSQRGPMIYSRRFSQNYKSTPKASPTKAALSTSHRKLSVLDLAVEYTGLHSSHRKLLWRDVPEDVWVFRRSHAATMLSSYFGSLNNGSHGWCHNTKYRNGSSCTPQFAEPKMLPWMKSDNTPNDTCP